MNIDDLSDFKQRLERELAQLDVSYAGAAAAVSYGGYHESASVLATFTPATLKPSGITAPDAHIEDVLSNSTLVSDPDGQSRWTLSPSVRSDVLRQLATRDKMIRALDANPERPHSVLQQTLEAYVRDQAPPLEAQSLIQLTATFQVSDWLRPVLAVPDREAIAIRIDFAGLLRPLEELAGEHFSGRRAELNRLREYVEVLPPDSTLGAVRQWFERGVKEILSLHERPPLLIYGPGGMGKSTLLARFILEHARLDETRRIPFAYLDFDRAELREDEPLTLLIEAVRQLGLQYVHAHEACEHIRADWQRRLVESTRRRSASAGSKKAPARRLELTPFITGFGDLLATLNLGGKPILLVLDTFEEIQWRSDAGVRTLMTFLGALQARVPRLRVVIAGRATMPGQVTDDLALKELDPEAAQAYLQKKGITDPKVAANVVRRIGGNPLTLRLAAEVVESEGVAALDSGGLDQLSVQRHLFRRILGRLHDADVRKLAHPGLVLRRITPPIILEVLAEPCELSVPDLAAATRLFDALKREVALVTPAEGDAVRHRPELRRIMLPLLERDRPAVVADIHRRAVQFYESGTTLLDRAEEIYHRLSLQQPPTAIDQRWLPGVEPFLANAVDDLQPAQRAYLASRLGVGLDDRAREAAALVDWERDAERRMRDWLAHNKPEDALAVVAERPDRQPGTVIDGLHAAALDRLGRSPEAVAVLEAAIHLAPVDLKCELLLAAARGYMSLGRLADAHAALDHASALTSTRGPMFQVEITVLRIQADRLTGDVARLEADTNVLRSLLDSIDNERLGREPAMARSVPFFLELRDSTTLARLVRLLGFEGITSPQRRALSLAMASWDMEVSRTADDQAGLIARALGLPSREKLSDSWEVIRTGEPRRVAETVATVLERYPLSLGDQAAATAFMRAVVDALAADYDQQETRDLDAHADAEHQGGNRRSAALSGRQAQQFVEAIVDAFPQVYDLEALLAVHLDRSLPTLTMASTLSAMAFEVVTNAQANGWLLELLLAAREAAPGNPGLQALASEFGIGSATRAELASIERVVTKSPGFLDLATWRARLAMLEGQVCRIELKGRPSGTAFLVAPDLVMTAQHVVQEVIEKGTAPEDVICRFDLTVAGGRRLNAGTEIRLSPRDWLVSSSPSQAGEIASPDGDETDPNFLDYALLRLDGFPGAEPIGRSRDNYHAPRRGWIELPSSPHQLAASAPLVILQHPIGEPLRLATDAAAFVGVNADGTRLLHRVPTLPGSSGSPCFSSAWDLMAMHHASRLPSGLGEAITISAIVADLERKRVMHLLGGRGLA